MRKTLTLFTACIIAVFVMLQINQQKALSYDGGAPSGYANDPASGSKNCTQCHGGSASTVTGWITSNIPGAGYTPGTAYQITVTMTGTGGNKGFSVSPQSSSGSFLGTLTAGTGTGLNGTNHYVRSTGSGVTTNPMSWTFGWTSPATGLGPVTFYGAFAIGTGTTKITSYTVTEALTGMTEAEENNMAMTVYPNPSTEGVTVSYTLTSSEQVSINLFNLDGQKVACLMNCEQQKGSYSRTFNLKDMVSKGMYLIELKTNGTSLLEKIIVQ